MSHFPQRFRKDALCLEYLFKRKFPHAVCPQCGRRDSFHRHSAKQCYSCNCGKSHIYPRKGTLFQSSPLPLSQWFYAIFLVCESIDGISAKEIERRLKVAYPTAWRMTARIRAIVQKERQCCGRAPSFDQVLKQCIATPTTASCESTSK